MAVPIDQAGSDDAVAPLQRVKGWQAWLLFMLTFTVVLSFADRSILSILIDPIKADLAISDVKASLLMGFAFTFVYALAALPLGAMVDVVDRRKLIAFAVLTWSAMIVLCGLASSFGQLFAGRMGLGIAEACLGPAAFSLIRDAFPTTQRGRAYAIYNSSHLIGTGSALLVGGTLFGIGSAGGFDNVPLLGALRPWQQVLVLLGLLGVPTAILMLTVREPARGAPPPAGRQRGYGEAVRFFVAHKAILLPFWLALALFAVAQGGMSSWAAMVVHRSWDVPIPEVGRVLGPIQIVVALAGSLTMGTTMDVLARRGRSDAPFLVCSVALSIACLAIFAQFFLTSLGGAAAAYIVQIFFFSAYTIAGGAGLALIAPHALGGKLQAIMGLATTMVGLSSGPTIVALVSSYFYSGPNALHDGLVTVAVIVVAIGATLFALSGRAYLRLRQEDGA